MAAGVQDAIAYWHERDQLGGDTLAQYESLIPCMHFLNSLVKGVPLHHIQCQSSDKNHLNRCALTACTRPD